MRELWQDVRYALRILTKNPGVTIVAALTLALGIGANTAIFSVVNVVLLRPVPYPQSDRLVWFWDVQPGLAQAPFPGADYMDFTAQSHEFETISAVRPMSFTLTGRGEAERVPGCMVTANVFSMLRVQPILGHAFLPEDGKPGAARVVLLSNGFWKRRFGADPAIVGRVLTLNSEEATVIGVLPANFHFFGDRDLWANSRNVVPELFPTSPQDMRANRGTHYMYILGRMRAGATLAQAQMEMDAIAQRRREAHPDITHGIHLVSLREFSVAEIRTTLFVLLGVVGFVLLIACANVANILLARAAARSKEMAIRAALGAGRLRLIRQLLTESTLLALVGGLGGVLLAHWGVKALVAARPANLPWQEEMGVDLPVLGFALGLSILTGLVFGLAPAFEASRASLFETLKEGGRNSSSGRQGNRLRGVLVVSEVALSLMLLVGAGLLIRSFVVLLEVKPGFRPDRILTVNLSLAGQKYSHSEQIIAFAQSLLPRLAALPGVQSVAVANDLPLEGQDTTGYPTIEGRPAATQGDQVVVGQHMANPGYFAALGIPLVRGREFSAQDTATSPRVAVISQAMARRFWPNEDPIGKKFRLFAGDAREVVGVVGDVKSNGLENETPLDAYVPLFQDPWSYMCVSVRTARDSQGLLAAVRSAVAELDPDLPVYHVRKMDEVMASSLSSRRLTLSLIALFAFVALVLAKVGIYGVMSYSVTQRTHEIGVRMALGAQTGDVLRLVVGQGMRLALLGLGIGVMGALWLARLMAGLLYEVKPRDPTTFVGVALLLSVVALLACYIPARRATRVDPLVALRYE